MGLSLVERLGRKRRSTAAGGGSASSPVREGSTSGEEDLEEAGASNQKKRRADESSIVADVVVPTSTGVDDLGASASVSEAAQEAVTGYHMTEQDLKDYLRYKEFMNRRAQEAVGLSTSGGGGAIVGGVVSATGSVAAPGVVPTSGPGPAAVGEEESK